MKAIIKNATLVRNQRILKRKTLIVIFLFSIKTAGIAVDNGWLESETWEIINVVTDKSLEMIRENEELREEAYHLGIHNQRELRRARQFPY